MNKYLFITMDNLYQILAACKQSNSRPRSYDRKGSKNTNPIAEWDL